MHTEETILKVGIGKSQLIAFSSIVGLCSDIADHHTMRLQDWLWSMPASKDRVVHVPEKLSGSLFPYALFYFPITMAGENV